jgi:hypothetical protein
MEFVFFAYYIEKYTIFTLISAILLKVIIRYNYMVREEKAPANFWRSCSIAQLSQCRIAIYPCQIQFEVK